MNWKKFSEWLDEPCMAIRFEKRMEVSVDEAIQMNQEIQRLKQENFRLRRLLEEKNMGLLE